MEHCYTPINGLPQEGGGVCKPREFDLVKRTRVRILTPLEPPEKWEIWHSRHLAKRRGPGND